MRICLIADMNSIHVRRWSAYFRKGGHTVQIVSLTKNNGFAEEYDDYRYVPPKSGFLAYGRRALPIAGVVRDFDPDIIHGHYLTSSGFYGVASRVNTDRVVSSAWGSDLYSDAKVWSKRQCIKYAIKHSKVTLADSDHLVGEVKKLVPNADARKVVFGVDTDLFKPNPIKHDKFRFLSLRATSKLYNPMIIVQAFEDSGLDAELWIQKPSPDCFDVYDYVKSNPELDKKVIWLDKRPYEQMPELYNSVDVGISIPDWDSSSTAMLECMSSGVPVVASRIPQNDEWLLPFLHNGMPTRINVEDVADRMCECQDYPLKAMGMNARELVMRKADFNTEMTKAESIYQEVLEG